MIELDTAEQKKMDEELRERFKKAAEEERIDDVALISLATGIYFASPEDFQLLKHAAKDIADRHGL